MKIDQFKPGAYYYVWNKDSNGELVKDDPYLIVRIFYQAEPYRAAGQPKPKPQTWVIYPDDWDDRSCQIEKFDKTLVIGMVPRPKLDFE